MPHTKLLNEWNRAGKDLGLQIVAPFKLDLGHGSEILAPLLVRYFGGRNGTIVVTEYATVEPHVERLRQLGYGFSTLSEPTNDDSYDRSIFIEMLSEWEWTGDPAQKPHWIIENDGE